MTYSHTDIPQLQRAILGEGGLWPMIKKDLFQMVNLPSYFNKEENPNLGTGLNLSVVIVTMSALETIATLANINGVIGGRDRGYATDVVVAFGEQYFPRVNPRYYPNQGSSLVRLLWDAYRNGGLHKFLPKEAEVANVAGNPKRVVFAVSWAEDPSRSNPSYTVEEIKRLRGIDPTLASLGHLALTPIGADLFRFTLCAQALVLEFAESVHEWQKELMSDPALHPWFLEGANAFDLGRKLNRAGCDWLACRI